MKLVFTSRKCILANRVWKHTYNSCFELGKKGLKIFVENLKRCGHSVWIACKFKSLTKKLNL